MHESVILPADMNINLLADVNINLYHSELIFIEVGYLPTVLHLSNT